MVTDLDVPQLNAGGGVKGHQMCVQRAPEDLVFIQSDTAVVGATAQVHIFKIVVVAPQGFT